VFHFYRLRDRFSARSGGSERVPLTQARASEAVDHWDADDDAWEASSDSATQTQQ
jgi:hypothetical protein